MPIWKPHFYRVGSLPTQLDTPPLEKEILTHRKKIEPWLSAILQSEHLSLFLGSGFTTAVSHLTGGKPIQMAKASFKCQAEAEVNAYADQSAKTMGRGEANIEDQIRAALSLVAGLEILRDKRSGDWKKALDAVLGEFVNGVLTCEKDIKASIEKADEKGETAKNLLVAFLLSFASRTATRERLHIFTTNYDRLIEYGCDLVGLRTIDRFVGTLAPVFRSSRLEVDLHYNPPGIRGEPRYLEGVVKLTKLHGSVDWKYSQKQIQKTALSFGSTDKVISEPLNSLLIYPNPAKDIETLEFPYAELFRDYCGAICRPNSVLITYGYGFGDDHINRVIADMLTIPSTHLVIISYDDALGRIPKFCEKAGHEAQISLLLGSHFGDLQILVENYLPKPAIDHITRRKTNLLKDRGEDVVRDAGAADSSLEDLLK